MTYFRWPNKTGIGSSYCLDQSPGAERYGGLTVTIRWRTGEKGTIASKATDFHKSGTLDESLVHALARVAEEGLREAAWGLNVDLNDFDITLSRLRLSSCRFTGRALPARRRKRISLGMGGVGTLVRCYSGETEAVEVLAASPQQNPSCFATPGPLPMARRGWEVCTAPAPLI
jgi:hypothetical protein